MQKLLATPNATFIDPKEELWMIALPLIGGFLTIFFWILGRFDISFGINDTALMLSSLIFVDSIHILFTFVLMASLPELRSWAKNPDTVQKSGWLKGMGPWARSLVISIALGVVIWLLKVSPALSTLKGMATTYLFLELLGPAQHTMAQMRGISFCYNSSLRKRFDFTDAEKAVAMKCEQLERFFFTALLTGEVMYWLPTIFELDKIQFPIVEDISFAGGGIAIAAATAIIVNAFYFPRQEHSRKMAFIVRVMLFPLKMLTTIGGITLRAAHGTEYFFVFRRMVTGSKITAARRRKIYLTTFALSLLYAIPFCITWPQGTEGLTGYVVSDRLLAWAIFGTFILRFAHYYMDAVLYKMSDPATRAAVGPILTSPPPGFVPPPVPSTEPVPMVGLKVETKRYKQKKARA